MLLPVLAATAAAAAAGLDVVQQADGSFRVLVDNEVWFQSGKPSLHNYGTLELLGSMPDERGGLRHTWGASGVKMETHIDVNHEDGYAVFTQSFPEGAQNLSTGDKDKITTAFPVLVPQWESPKGVVAYQGDMTGDGVKSGAWSASAGKWHKTEGSTVIGEGISGTGPVVVFSTDLTRSLVLSPFSQFMAASQTFSSDSGLSYGVMGMVGSLPKGFSLQTVVVLGSGVNSAMQTWGDVLLAKSGKQRYAYKNDLAMQTLGYSTDNGAYYYYQTEPGKNYEDTLHDVKKYSEKVGIPYRYILLDSWWYYKGGKGGVSTWDARPDIFPSGLEALYKATNWPQQLHNRYWSPNTTYAKQNGGDYNFVFDGSSVVVPDDQTFWNDLVANKTKSGAFMYEQDWLDVEFDRSTSLLSDVALGRTWMQQMNAGAVHGKQTIQMCMSHVRHILQSVEMSAVTNARASGDYHPGNDQWNTGTTAILAHAVGIAPSKDNYWSTPVQSGTHYGPTTREPYNRLQALASTLTNGPVAPSDAVNASDAALVMRCCDTTGRLLSADKPAMEIDAHFLYAATGKGVDGNLWTTHSTVSGTRSSYALGVNLKSEYNLTLKELGFAKGSRVFAVETNASQTVTLVTDDAPLQFRKSDKADFQYFVAVEAPSPGSFAFLGEPDKWVSVSQQRFSGLTATSVDIQGGAGEKVGVRWANSDGVVTSGVCQLSTAGKGSATLKSGAVHCN
eukprot:Hpha_TRINITY_DN13618_c0_g1::TRINITY_DN13618_c0_g1_i1::g.122626::m.122626